MNFKKVISLILVGVMSTATLGGCGSSGGDSGTISEESGSKNETVSKDSGKTKLTALFVKHSLTKDVEEMEWLKKLEEEAGVEIEWQQISADWDQKKSTLFGSGDIPDLLFNATTDADYSQFDGLFEDWTPWIVQYGSNISTMLEEEPQMKTLATTLEDKIFGLPAYHQQWANTRPLFINQTWLENLNLEMPTTWEELENVLIAFKEQDANGNGDASDEIPMDTQAIPQIYSPIYLLGSLGLPLSDNAADGYFAEDGTVKNIFVDDRFKVLVETLREWWSMGLINNEMFTQEYSQYQSLARGEGTTAKVGLTWGWTASDRFGNGVKDQYVVVEPLKYTKDQDISEVTWMNCDNSLSVKGNAVAMSAACKDKEAATRFVDLFYGKTVGMQVYYGGMNDIDKGIQDNGDGTYSVMAPADTAMDPGTWKWTNTFADNGAYYIPDDLQLTLGQDMQDVVNERVPYQEALKRITGNDVYPQVFMKYSADDISTLAMNQTNINNITSQQFAAWVTGEGDIEKDWDSFVKSLYDVGLTENLTIRQAAFDNYLEISQ